MKILLSLLVVFFCISSATAEDPPFTFDRQQNVPSKKLPEATDAQPFGVLIDASNAPDYRSLIIPEFYGYVRSHQMFLDAAARLKADLALVKLSSSPTLSKINDLLLANGELKASARIDRGLPFPEWRDEADADRRARMLLWNIQSVRWSAKLYKANLKLLWLENSRATKKVLGEWVLAFPQPLNPDDKSIQLFREKIAFFSPSFLKGFSWLTFRFLGKEEDMLWHSSSITNKTIQLTGSNRSDSIFNSALSLDDLLLWNGKTELVVPKVEAETEKLAPFANLDFKELKQSGPCFVVNDTSDKSDAKLNYESHRFPDGFDWLPSGAVYVPRKMLKIELVPLDPFAFYGRQVLYVDSELMIPYYKFVYNRAGYLWKSEMAVYGVAKTGDSSRATTFLDFMVIDDRESKQSNIISYSNQTTCDQFPDNLKITDLEPQQMGVR